MATGGLYTDIKSILEQAKANAIRAVNFSMVVAYWEIGKRIVEEEQQGEGRASYGKGILKDLLKKLTIDFGEGFSAVSLENFRKFYLVFSKKSISSAVRRKLEDENADLRITFVDVDLATDEKPEGVCRKLEDENSVFLILIIYGLIFPFLFYN